LVSAPLGRAGRAYLSSTRSYSVRFFLSSLCGKVHVYRSSTGIFPFIQVSSTSIINCVPQRSHPSSRILSSQFLKFLIRKHRKPQTGSACRLKTRFPRGLFAWTLLPGLWWSRSSPSEPAVQMRDAGHAVVIYGYRGDGCRSGRCGRLSRCLAQSLRCISRCSSSLES